MAPRQLVRLYESRKSESFDDQKTPDQIAASESLALTHQDFLEYVLSQIRQILGTDNWHDPVPVNLLDLFQNTNTVEAECLATDSVGDAVCARIEDGGLYRVFQCDPNDEAKMPAWGVIISKSSDTECRVQYGGIVDGLYGGLELRKTLFVDTDGGLTQDLPVVVPGDRMFVQAMGVALDDSVFLLNPTPTMFRRRG